jgi:FMN phosphatase YigB (HAD superfamily)
VKTQKHKKLFNKFDHIVTGGSDDEVKKGKPAPDIFLIAASRFKDKPKPENVSLGRFSNFRKKLLKFSKKIKKLF